jgi:hypothetical protein
VQTTGATTEHTYKHSLDFCPLSPLFKIYALQYSYEFSKNNELILAPAYLNIHYDFGNTNASALILGYRRYLHKTIHLEYQVWPTFDNFYEKNDDKHYKSFDVWNEFRLGWRWDFTVGTVPVYINLQWPFGFGLYASNKPQSFLDQQKKEPYFYFPPMFFTGIQF